MAEKFVTFNLEDILVGEELPGTLFVYINFRFITFRAGGDAMDRAAYDRLELKKVRSLFIQEQDQRKFADWSARRKNETVPPLAPEHHGFAQVREDVRRRTVELFQSQHPDRLVAQTLEASKKLVAEVMKFQYAVQNLAQLQTYSQGTVDHSMNVSTLSVYLAMQMGYSHTLILQHVGMGGLLHDIGKPKVPIQESDPDDIIEDKMKEHPTWGSRLLEAQQKVPNEVKMIVAQHHECHDGTGFPKKLRGSGIYDLARIVSIANVFDELVADGTGTLLERQRVAVKQLDETLFRKFDPQKLEKALKILKLGI